MKSKMIYEIKYRTKQNLGKLYCFAQETQIYFICEEENIEDFNAIYINRS